MKPDVALVAELIMEVERRRKVGDVSDGVNVNPSIILYEIRTLRLNQESHVIVIFLFPVSEGESHVMGKVLVFRIATQITVEILLHGIVDGREPRIPIAINSLDT